MDDSQITLKSARVNAKLTLVKAAEKLGVSEKTLRNWEHGKTFPSTSFIKKIEEVYNISIANIRFS